MTAMRHPSLVPSVLALLVAAALGGCSAPGIPRAEPAEFGSHAESAEFAEADGGKASGARPDFATAVAVGAIHCLMMSLVDGDPDAISRILPSFAADCEKRATVEAYPDADEVSLFEWESTRYETNGTYTTTWTTVSRILTQRGLEENRTFSFGNDEHVLTSLDPGNVYGLMATPNLWIGVVAGVALIAAAIWYRQRRIETAT
jgi:hypothetical protein